MLEHYNYRPRRENNTRSLIHIITQPPFIFHAWINLLTRSAKVEYKAVHVLDHVTYCTGAYTCTELVRDAHLSYAYNN